MLQIILLTSNSDYNAHVYICMCNAGLIVKGIHIAKIIINMQPRIQVSPINYS